MMDNSTGNGGNQGDNATQAVSDKQVQGQGTETNAKNESKRKTKRESKKNEEKAKKARTEFDWSQACEACDLEWIRPATVAQYPPQAKKKAPKEETVAVCVLRRRGKDDQTSNAKVQPTNNDDSKNNGTSKSKKKAASKKESTSTRKSKSKALVPDDGTEYLMVRRPGAFLSFSFCPVLSLSPSIYLYLSSESVFLSFLARTMFLFVSFFLVLSALALELCGSVSLCRYHMVWEMSSDRSPGLVR